MHRGPLIIRMVCHPGFESFLLNVQTERRMILKRIKPCRRPYSSSDLSSSSRTRQFWNRIPTRHLNGTHISSLGCRKMTSKHNEAIDNSDLHQEQKIDEPRKLNVYDDSDKWQDWFPREEYLDPWGESLEPLDYEPLDHDTRTLIQELQNTFHGIPSNLDAPITTELCNLAIKDLNDLSLGSKKLKGRAERAHMILKCMELFYSLPPRDPKIQLPWPLPSRETYFGVLKLFASSTAHFSDRRVPETCMEIIKRIEARYQEKGGWVKQGKESQQTAAPLILRPNVVMWNQVLSAWATCTDEQKAYEAANLLKQLKEKDLVDSSTYGHVLRACAFSNQSNASKKLASEVAVFVWDDFTNNTQGLEPTSYMYAFYLQACQYIARASRRDEKVQEAFRHCCQHGMVNAHVIHALKMAASSKLYNKLMQEGIEDFGKKRHLGDSVLAQQLPYEWACNSNVTNQLGW